jgi:hypothetical protein
MRGQAEEVVAEAKSECYSSIKSKDTVTMDLKIDKDLSVVGIVLSIFRKR